MLLLLVHVYYFYYLAEIISTNPNNSKGRSLSKAPRISMPNLSSASGSEKQSNNGVLYELLIDIIKNSETRSFSKAECNDLINTLINNNESVIQFYLFKGFRYLYIFIYFRFDKDPIFVNGQLFSLSNSILSSLSNQFILYGMTYIKYYLLE